MVETWRFLLQLAGKVAPDSQSSHCEIFVQGEDQGGFLSVAFHEVLIEGGKPGVLTHFL